MQGIAIDLNHDGTLSPQPREGRSQSWAHSSVRHILLNERYRGVVLWEKTRKVGSPKGARVYQHHGAVWKSPEQRIVSEELWNRPHKRLRLVQDLYGIREGKRRGRAAASPYLSLDCSSVPSAEAASPLFRADAASEGIRVVRNA